MTHRVAVQARPSVAARFGAFVLERHPFAAAAAASALEILADTCGDLTTAEAIERAARGCPRSSAARSRRRRQNLPEPTPARGRARALGGGGRRARRGVRRLPAPRGDRASLTADERREILRGMVLTRATDNRLKAFFTGGEVRYGDAAFQGKGFRSLGQEAIYAAGIRLRRGDAIARADGWRGDVVAPLIRDLGVALAMRRADKPGETVRMVLVGADGQGRAADGRQGPAHRRLRVGHPARGRAAGDRDADDRRNGDGVRARGRAAASRSRSSAKAARRSASGTRRSTSAPRAGCPRSSASRTTRPRCRRRSRDQSAVRVFADKAPATASPASRSTAPIPTRSPRRSPGRPNGRATGKGPR